MKNRVFCLILGLCLLIASSASAWTAEGFYRRTQYGEMESYQNIPFDYELSLYNQFYMVDDETLDQFWAHIDAEHKDTDDDIYDLRVWYSADGRYQFEVQVKQPTYDSFETEIAKAPEYMALMKDNYDPESNPKQLHDGILRETPAGTMLETAISYDIFGEDGTVYHTVFVYYDIYLKGVEYCFSIYAYDGDYASAQALLDEVAQTVRLQAFSHPA